MEGMTELDCDEEDRGNEKTSGALLILILFALAFRLILLKAAGYRLGCL